MGRWPTRWCGPGGAVDFDLLDRRLQIEITNPVQTKVQRFAGRRAARSSWGSRPRPSTRRAWLRDGAIVIVDAAKGAVGEDTAALVGATLLNLVALAVGEQAALAPGARRPVASWSTSSTPCPGPTTRPLLSELAKYGANLVLATQSLARLDALDREQQRALRPTLFANLDGLFAFHCSAEDAEYLVRELGPDVDEADLVSLGEHRCYARVSHAGERLPVFSVRLDAPAGERRPPGGRAGRRLRRRATGAPPPPSRPTWRRPWRASPRPAGRRRGPARPGPASRPGPPRPPGRAGGGRPAGPGEVRRGAAGPQRAPAAESAGGAGGAPGAPDAGGVAPRRTRGPSSTRRAWPRPGRAKAPRARRRTARGSRPRDRRRRRRRPAGAGWRWRDARAAAGGLRRRPADRRALLLLARLPLLPDRGDGAAGGAARRGQRLPGAAAPARGRAGRRRAGAPRARPRPAPVLPDRPRRGRGGPRPGRRRGPPRPAVRAAPGRPPPAPGGAAAAPGDLRPAGGGGGLAPRPARPAGLGAPLAAALPAAGGEAPVVGHPAGLRRGRVGRGRAAECLLVPDLATFPLRAYRPALARLVALRALGGALPALVVATTDPGRARAWEQLVDEVRAAPGPRRPWSPASSPGTRCRAGPVGEPGRAVSRGRWTASRARRTRCPAAGRRRWCGASASPGRRPPASTGRCRAWSAASRWAARPPVGRSAPEALVGAERSGGSGAAVDPVALRLATSDRALLDLVGRHPFLRSEQLAVLLGCPPGPPGAGAPGCAPPACSGRWSWMVASGSDGARGAGAACGRAGGGEPSDRCERRDRWELTAPGLALVAAQEGLSLAAAVRVNGLAGGGPERPVGARRTLLRRLAHTVGADGVFVRLAAAARRQAAAGADDALLEWRNAAACAWRHVRPDGYGLYRHAGRLYGLFLEYDRGTMTARDHRRKFAAYHHYLASGRFEREYRGFPDRPGGHGRARAGGADRRGRAVGGGRLGRAAARAADDDGRLAAARDGLLGPIWRAPDPGPRRRWPAPAGRRRRRGPRGPQAGRPSLDRRGPRPRAGRRVSRGRGTRQKGRRRPSARSVRRRWRQQD